jgi:hypothetical protein
MTMKHPSGSPSMPFARPVILTIAWRGTIRGEADATVEYVMDGAAQSTFLATRIGFCVLNLLAECAGRTCVIEKTSGALEYAAAQLDRPRRRRAFHPCRRSGEQAPATGE